VEPKPHHSVLPLSTERYVSRQQQLKCHPHFFQSAFGHALKRDAETVENIQRFVNDFLDGICFFAVGHKSLARRKPPLLAQTQTIPSAWVNCDIKFQNCYGECWNQGMF